MIETLTHIDLQHNQFQFPDLQLAQKLVKLVKESKIIIVNLENNNLGVEFSACGMEIHQNFDFRDTEPMLTVEDFGRASEVHFRSVNHWDCTCESDGSHK